MYSDWEDVTSSGRAFQVFRSASMILEIMQISKKWSMKNFTLGWLGSVVVRRLDL